VDARCRAVSKAVTELPIPPTANVLMVIRDGVARGAASAAPLAAGDYVLALAGPADLALLDRMFEPRPGRNSPEERGLLGEFSFDGMTALAVIAHLYDPAAETDAALTLAEFLAGKFHGRPAIGDRTRFGAVELIVRDMQRDAITQVGVELDPAPEHPWRSWLWRLYRRPSILTRWHRGRDARTLGGEARPDTDRRGGGDRAGD